MCSIAPKRLHSLATFEVMPMPIHLKIPLVLTSDDALTNVSRDNPGYQIERDADGTLIVSPTHTKGGAKSAEALGQLRDYKKNVGGNIFDSNAGFAIGPGLRVYSPDASWVSQPRIDALSERAAAGFWPISPDVAIEVRSDTDMFANTVAKVDIFVARGSTYAVAIDPQTREVIERGTPPSGLQLNFDDIIDA
jgi:Uma2 family endonuclease